MTIAVPTSAHAEVGLAALEAGRPALMEKPLAATVGEADRLIDRALASGTLLQVGHIERFNRALRAAVGYLGHPLFIEGERLAPYQPRGTDVPVVLDLMIHELDLILHLAGGPTAVDVRANGAAVLSPLLDVAHARVEFDTGLVASVTASRIAENRVRRLRVYQEEGYLSAGPGDGAGGVPPPQEWVDAGRRSLPRRCRRAHPPRGTLGGRPAARAGELPACGARRR